MVMSVDNSIIREKATHIRCNPSTMMKIEIKMRKIPLAKPDKVCMRLYL